MYTQVPSSGGLITFAACRPSMSQIPPHAKTVSCISADLRFESPREQRIVKRYPHLVRDLADCYLGTDRPDRVGKCTYYSNAYFIVTRQNHEERPSLMSIQKAIRNLARQTTAEGTLVFNLTEDDLACYEVETIMRILGNEFSRPIPRRSKPLVLFLCLPKEEFKNE